MTELTEKDLVFLQTKYPINRVFASPSISSPALLYLLLEVMEMNQLLKRYMGIEEQQEEEDNDA